MNKRQILKQLLAGKVGAAVLRKHLGIVNVLFTTTNNVDPDVILLEFGTKKSKVNQAEFSQMDKSSFDMIWEEIKTYDN